MASRPFENNGNYGNERGRFVQIPNTGTGGFSGVVKIVPLSSLVQQPRGETYVPVVSQNSTLVPMISTMGYNNAGSDALWNYGIGRRGFPASLHQAQGGGVADNWLISESSRLPLTQMAVALPMTCNMSEARLSHLLQTNQANRSQGPSLTYVAVGSDFSSLLNNNTQYAQPAGLSNFYLAQANGQPELIPSMVTSAPVSAPSQALLAPTPVIARTTTNMRQPMLLVGAGRSCLDNNNINLLSNDKLTEMAPHAVSSRTLPVDNSPVQSRKRYIAQTVTERQLSPCSTAKEDAEEDSNASERQITQENRDSVLTRSFLLKQKPKRPLSAYNLFFRDERERLVEAAKRKQDEADPDMNDFHEDTTGGNRSGQNLAKKRRKKSHGITFEGMAKEISQKWHALDDSLRVNYVKMAEAEKQRYACEKAVYAQYEKGALEEIHQEQKTSR